MECLFNFVYTLPPKQATLVAVLLGFVLIDDLSADKQNALGNFLILIGQVLATNATVQDLSDSLIVNDDTEQMKKDIEDLKRQIAKLNK